MLKFFRIPPDDASSHSSNRLHQFIQSCSVQDMAKLAAEINPEVKQVIGMNVQALLGYLPTSDFNTTISASKENMQNLLASAMLTGYFLHALENRMLMEKIFQQEQDDPDTVSLKSPQELFPKPAPKVESDPLIPGRFLKKQELLEEIENTEVADIQVEINATSLDLTALLEELQSLNIPENIVPAEDPPFPGSEGNNR